MWLFQDFLDQSKQLNQTPSRSLPAYHPPNKKYKIIHQALTIPNLPDIDTIQTNARQDQNAIW